MKELFKNKKAITSKQTFLILLLFQCLVLAYILVFCSIKYEVSDDFVVELLLSGGYSGQINWHMPFSNPILGIILASCYKVLNRSISWYLIFLLAIGFASYISISWVLSKKNNKLLGIVATVLLTMATAGDVYVLPQFTKTAAVAMIAGSVLFLHGVFFDNSKLSILFGTVITVIGSFIRYRALYSVAVPIAIITIICLIKSFIKYRNKLHWLLQRVIPCSLLVLLVFLLHLLGNAIYKADPYYSYYKEYNSARSRIVDYAHVDYSEFKEKLYEIGLGATDYYLLIKWNFGDPDKYSLNRMNQAADILDQYRIENEVTFEYIADHITERDYIIYPVVCCLLLLGVICIVANWRKFWIPLLCIISSLFYICVYFAIGRSLYRVEFGPFFAATVVIAVFIDRERASKIELFRSIICCLLSCAAIGYMGMMWFPKTPCSDVSVDRANLYDSLGDSWSYKPEKYSFDLRNTKIYEDFTELVKNNPQNIYLLEFATTIQSYYYNFSPFKSGVSVFPENVLWIADTTTEYPSTRQWRDRHEIRSTLKAVVIDNVYYVGNKLDELVEVYLGLNEYPDANRELVDVVDGYNIYKYHEQ